MKKSIQIAISLIFVVLLVLSVGACANRNAIDNDPEEAVAGESKILVAYFSWSGNVQKLANMIADNTGGELFRIIAEDMYSTSYNETVSRARQELNEGTRPAISTHIDPEIMAQYDVIYLGYPIWWSELPMPVVTFLEEYDLSGKTIIPFFSHQGTSSGGSSLSTLEDICSHSTALTDQALSVKGSTVDEAQSYVEEWLTGLNY